MFRKTLMNDNMFLKFILPSFLFISLPILVFAYPCEKGFLPAEIFISFTKKKMGKAFEKELGADWSAKVTQNTKHWTHTEASQFLDFLLNRIGEKATVERLKYFPDFPQVSYKDFIKKITVYDKIDKKIINSVLKSGEISLSLFVTKDFPQEMIRLVENYIGIQGVVYLLSNPITYEMFFTADPREMKKVIDFTDRYTKKHVFSTDTLQNRLNFFEVLATSFPLPQIRMSDIRFTNFSELIEFSKLIFTKLREADEKIEDETATEKTLNLHLPNRVVLRYIINTLIAPFFSAYSQTSFNNLKETVDILEQYIKPEEIANMMVNKAEIYSVNSKNLKETIDILQKAHSIPSQENIYEAKERMLKEIESARTTGNAESNLVVPLITIVGQMSAPPFNPKGFIAYMIRQYKIDFLLANPTHIKEVMAILEKYIPRHHWSFILQPQKFKEIQYGLLLANPNDLQKIIDAFEKHLERGEVVYLILNHFTAISMIKEKTSESFLRIVETLKTHVDAKSIRIAHIEELLEHYFFIPEIDSTLSKTSAISNYNTMKKILTELPILEFSSSMQETENSIKKDASDLSSFN